MTDQKIIEKTKKTINDFENEYIEGPMGYKFRTYSMLSVLFLYNNGVNKAEPDILNSSNTMINPMVPIRRKILEQIMLDIKDIGFLIHGSSPLARFVLKAANRNLLKQNRFDYEMDLIPKYAMDYGSGFLKQWRGVDKRLKLKAIEPYMLIFDQYNFAKGYKIERVHTTARRIIDNDKYDSVARELLQSKIGDEDKKLDETFVIYQVCDPQDNGNSVNVYMVDTEHELIYFRDIGNKDLRYYKHDYQKRDGFPDALGVGINEIAFNYIVQDKKNRLRLDSVLEIASKLVFQKQIDGENDDNVKRDIIKLSTGKVIGHKGNKLEQLEIGGDRQIAMLNSELQKVANTVTTYLNLGDALAGNTLPSNTSAALGTLLTENASSVHKEAQKAYANFISHVYDTGLIEELLNVFDSESTMRRFLDPNDIRLIEQNVIDYLTAQIQIESEIKGNAIDVQQAREFAKRKVSGKEFMPGDLLKSLRNDVKGIETFISGEQASKAQAVAFIRDLRATYLANPQAFTNPFFTELIMKEAQYDAGLSELEVGQLLKTLQDNQQ